jgi:hypothetical protein
MLYSIMREKWHGHRNGARQQNGFQMASDYNVSMINADGVVMRKSFLPGCSCFVRTLLTQSCYC